MNLIINPGTEPIEKTTEKNAIKLAEYIAEDLNLDITNWKRKPKNDDDKGRYGFVFKGAGGEVEVDIPGTDPDVTRKSEPWVSPRLYVGGSSWLYGYALSSIFDAIKKETV